MAKPKQFHVIAEGKGDRAVAHYLTVAKDETEASDRVQTTEFELWLYRSDENPTGREGQAEPYRVTSVEAE